MNQRHGDHVLNAVIAIGGVIERTFFIDDPNCRFVRADRDLPDVLDFPTRLRERRVQDHCGFHGRLRVEFSRERNLEEHVFHHIRTVRDAVHGQLAAVHVEDRQLGRTRGHHAAATLIGIGINFVGLDPIKALFWSAVINGVVAVPLMVIIMLMVMRQDVMGRFVLPRALWAMGWLCTVTTAVAVAVGIMFATW